MDLIDIPTEQTTAFTDGILAVVAILASVSLQLAGCGNRWKGRLWTWIFSLLAIAAIFGAVAHGFKMSDKLQSALWYPIYLSLGLLVALFSVAVVLDIWGHTRARPVLPIMLAAGLGFFVITLVRPDNFVVFIIYQAGAMMFALVGYTWLAYKRSLDGAWFMVVGVLLTIFAAAVQAAGSWSFTFIWSFDHNGIYHLIQMAGIVSLLAGLRKANISHDTIRRSEIL